MASNIYHAGVFSPPKFTSKAKFKERVEQYFNYCHEEERAPTVSGLALFLGMTRQTLNNYSKKEKFADVVRLAKQIIEEYLEEACSTPKGNSANQFVLRNNFDGWSKNDEEARIKLDLQGANINLTKIDISVLPLEEKVRYLTGRISSEELEKHAKS